MQSKTWMAAVMGAAIVVAVASQAWSGGACCSGDKKEHGDKASCGTNSCPAGMSKEDCKDKKEHCHGDKAEGTNAPAASSDEPAPASGM